MREEELISLLKEKGLHICCAESCTGGMLSSTLVNVVGASDALDMGFVTYANEAKIKLLGVDAKTIEHYGVVSEQVAEQMAARRRRSIRRAGGCRYFRHCRSRRQRI